MYVYADMCFNVNFEYIYLSRERDQVSLFFKFVVLG